MYATRVVCNYHNKTRDDGFFFFFFLRGSEKHHNIIILRKNTAPPTTTPDDWVSENRFATRFLYDTHDRSFTRFVQNENNNTTSESARGQRVTILFSSSDFLSVYWWSSTIGSKNVSDTLSRVRKQFSNREWFCFFFLHGNDFIKNNITIHLRRRGRRI